MHRPDQERGTVEVAILSRNELLRLGLQHIVENEPWIHVIGHAATATALDDLLTRDQTLLYDQQARRLRRSGRLG